MESPDKNESSCPSFEILSAYFDGECGEETVASHVAVCEQCRRSLEELAFIEKAVTRALEKSTPQDLPEKILAGVRERLKEERNRKSSFHLSAAFFVRAAALVAVLGMVGYFIWDDYSYRKAQTPVLSLPGSSRPRRCRRPFLLRRPGSGRCTSSVPLMCVNWIPQVFPTLRCMIPARRCPLPESMQGRSFPMR